MILNLLVNDMWKDQLKKDLVPHTTFISGVKPKAAVDIKPLEDLAIKFIEARLRFAKDTPKRLTGFIHDYVNEVMAPRAKKLMEENPELTRREAFNKSFDRVEYFKFVMKKNKDSLLNR